jgi:AcrR family transcriptional regulator
MPRVKQRTPDLRERVIDVAVAALANGGVRGFTARRIASMAGTSVPAVYELFGDKGGLVREVFFEGFRRLGRRLAELGQTDDPRRDILGGIAVYRSFVVENPRLAELMFTRPFAEFAPDPDELAAGAAVQKFVVNGVRRAIDAGVIVGDPIDIAHVIVATSQGLAAQEIGGRLGAPRSADRRWRLAVEALLDGLRSV